MDSSKKHVFSDQILSSRRKVLTRFGLGIAASLIVLTGLLLSNSFKGPFVSPLLQGFYSSSLNPSPGSWHFSFSSSSSSSSSSVGKQVQGIEGINVSSGDYKADNGEGKVLEKIDSVNLPGEGKVSSFDVEANGSFVAKKSSSVASDVGFTIVEKTQFGNSSEGNGTVTMVTINVGNFSYRGEERSRNTSFGGVNNNRTGTSYNSAYENCDIYDGRWVRVDDDTMPYYPPGSCPYIDRDFDCHLNRRPDDGYVKWRWQPNGCDIPSLNATDFLERLRGKKLVFVGDSLNRNMWESLVCILRHSVKDKKRVYEISGRTEFKKKGFYAFRFEDYNCTVDFVGSPFLIRESSFKRKNGSFGTLRLDLMDKTTSMYQDADILIFNTGHWWTHDKTKLGEDYYQEGNYVHPKLKVLEAYKRALTTWARWVDKNIDSRQTHVIYRGYSVTHFRGGPWNSGGQCHKETDPIFNTRYLAKYPSKMRALEHVLKDMKTPVIYMNISRLTDFRKDGHPSIYRMIYKTEQEKVESVKHQDCSHWCLPGVPDTWNELLYLSLLKAGIGSWKN